MGDARKSINLKTQFLDQAVLAIADGYCKINLTQDLIPGVIHQIVEGVDYNLNKEIGMPENSVFSKIVEVWSETVSEEERDGYLYNLNRERLLERFRNGERHIQFSYWTRTVTYDPLLAEEHLVLFKDEETGDILASDYILNRTEQYLLREYEKELELKNKELEELLEKEKKYNIKIYRDALTGVFNRRYYEEIIQNSSEAAGIALMDLDDFKVTNDTYGHHVGDLVLKTTANIIGSCLGARDLLVRYGGDEFLLILVGLSDVEFKAKLEEIREKVHNSRIQGYPHLHLSMSIGGAMKKIDDPTEIIVRRVDRMMYQAKNQKDEVVVYTEGEKSAHKNKKNIRQQILIVDDSMMNRELLSAILEENYRILEAENGQECLDKLYEHPNDIALVLLDINMPVMDGFEVLRSMNDNHIIEDIPVIMISSDDSEEVIRKAYEFGASDYVSRPFDAQVVYRRATNTIKLYTKQRRLVQMVSEQIQKQEHNTTMLVGVLSQIVEFRNGESGSHVRHIRVITEMLLSHLMEITGKYDISPEEQENISLASALHDIGKIAIDEKILNKPGKLTKEEFEIMKTHSMRGAEMIGKLENYEEEPLLHTAYEIARWHHERWGGSGYPDGLKEDEIPISAQIVSMADVYDALTSERCYKKAFTHEKAIEMILNGECGVFNPLLIQCLKDIQNDLKEELQSDYHAY